MNGRAIVIGNGGVGSWATPKLCYLVGRDRVLLIDKDRLTEANLDRQLFDADSVGGTKSAILADMYPGAGYLDEWFSATLAAELDLTSDDVLFCCADNHACRREVLSACDQYDCRCVIGANEYTDAEAYWYESSFRNTINDPRIVYPSILTDHSGDPLAPEGCTGEAQERSPQLALANDMAAALMLHLFWFHTVERLQLERSPEVEAYWPVHHKSSMWKITTLRKGDR